MNKLLLFIPVLTIVTSLSTVAFADGEDDGCSSSEGRKPGHCSPEKYYEPYIGADGRWHSTPDRPVPVIPGGPGPEYCSRHPYVCD